MNVAESITLRAVVRQARIDCCYKAATDKT